MINKIIVNKEFFEEGFMPKAGNNTMFCPFCSNLLMPKDEKLVCNCGYIGSDAIIKDKIEESIKIGVLQEEVITDGTSKVDCPRCDSTEAYSWVVQTQASDEPETMFFKCIKCKHHWRQYK